MKKIIKDILISQGYEEYEIKEIDDEIEIPLSIAIKNKNKFDTNTRIEIEKQYESAINEFIRYHKYEREVIIDDYDFINYLDTCMIYIEI